MRSDNLIKCVYGYGVKELEKLNSFEWDLSVEEIYEREKKMIVEALDLLYNMYMFHEEGSVVNVQKYHEILCKQFKIIREYGMNIPGKTKARLQDELDKEFATLDSAVIPGYEPEPTPVFTIGGVEVPDTVLIKRENRGRRKNDVMNTSALEDFYFLINYVEPPVNAAEVEADRLIELERERAKRGRGRPEGAKDKVRRKRRSMNMRREKRERREGETRGRKIGSKNVRATAETDANMVIHDREIVVRKIQTCFEQHLFKYSREHRDITYAEWINHVEKELNKIRDSVKDSIKKFLYDWHDVNSEEVFWLKKFFVFKTKFNETPYLEDHIRGWSDDNVIVDDGYRNRNGLSRRTIDIYRRFLKYCTNESIIIYINTLISDESPSETLYATKNEPKKVAPVRKVKRTEHDPNALNITYLPAREGERESDKNKIIASVNGIPIVSEYMQKRPVEATKEMIESMKHIPEDKRVFLPKRIVKAIKEKAKRKKKLEKKLGEELSEDEDYEYNYIYINERPPSFLPDTFESLPPMESKPKSIPKPAVRHIPTVDDPIFGHMDKYVPREKYVPVKLASEKFSPLKPFISNSRVITIKEDILYSKGFKRPTERECRSNVPVSSTQLNVPKQSVLTNSFKHISAVTPITNKTVSRPVSVSSLPIIPVKSINSIRPIINNPVNIPVIKSDISKPTAVTNSSIISKSTVTVEPIIRPTVTVKPIIKSAIIYKPTVTVEPIIKSTIIYKPAIIPKPINNSKTIIPESIEIITQHENVDIVENSDKDSNYGDLISFDEELYANSSTSNTIDEPLCLNIGDSNSDCSSSDSPNHYCNLEINCSSETEDSTVIMEKEASSCDESNDSNTPNVPDLINFDDESNMSSIPDTPSVQDMQDTSDFPDLINFDDELNMSSIPDTPNVQDVLDMQDMQDIISVQDTSDFPDMLNFDDEVIEYDYSSALGYDDLPELIDTDDIPHMTIIDKVLKCNERDRRKKQKITEHSVYNGLNSDESKTVERGFGTFSDLINYYKQVLLNNSVPDMISFDDDVVINNNSKHMIDINVSDDHYMKNL